MNRSKWFTLTLEARFSVSEQSDIQVLRLEHG